MDRTLSAVFLFLVVSILLAPPAVAQAGKTAPVPGNLADDMREFVSTPAVPGYETQLAEKIRSALAAFHPAIDNLGDVVLTLGSGAPHRLLVAPLDEPGFVVSEITAEGYLRVQRLPQFGLPPVFNELYSAQPVRIETATGKWLDGVVAGLSVHLAPGRTNPPKSSDLENFYIDVGATSVAEVRKAGVDLLSPVAINRRIFGLGSHWAGASIGDRFGAAALVELLRVADPKNILGTLTVAFVVQQYAGARGLQRILTTIPADEMIYVGRLLPSGPIPGVENIHRAPRRDPGSGVLLGLQQTDGSLTGLAADLKQLADAQKIPLQTDYSAGLIPRSYLPAPAFPARWAHLGVAAAWHDTPAEMFDSKDLHSLVELLDDYVEGPRSAGYAHSTVSAAYGVGPSNSPPSMTAILKNLVETYGVSNHEGPVRDAVKRLLPPWAKPETDDAGNLVLRLGTGPAGAKAPRILIVAHLDEIGFEVKSISKDGRLEAQWRGGGDLSFFAGHPALVHTSGGDRDAIIELPNQWDEPNFEWPRSPDTVVRVDVGARSPEEAEKLGVKVGDSITIPKKYRPLLGTRAIGRSFDDRVGDTALISAVRSLGGPLQNRDVTFVWSTGEELGLDGAAALAKRLAAEGRGPDYVFAVDTFVSSDPPLESKRFADAQAGKGFVVRAVDNSNIVPRALVDRVVKIARANQIPVQYGVAGGGNDGSAFLRYGSVDVALGWPLRYSHSPAEVVDTRDVDALARIVAAIARSW